MLRKPEEPIDYRMLHADGNYTDVGKRSRRRVQMLDDALGKAHRRFKISDEEYHGLLRYRFHWRCGGLSGHIGSVDLNRIFAHDPAAMSGLAKTEKMADHRDAYHAAHDAIGRTPAWVADNVACYDFPLVEVGVMMGYRSEAHARARAAEILSDAGYRLCRFWKDRDR
jgi:hypothetical protein